MESRTFTYPKQKDDEVILSLKNFLKSIGLMVREVKEDNGSVLIQTRKPQEWKKFAGLSTAADIRIFRNSDSVTISISGGKWVDKCAVAGVSLLVLWPIAVTAAVGTYQQSSLPTKIFDFLSTKILKDFHSSEWEHP